MKTYPQTPGAKGSAETGRQAAEAVTNKAAKLRLQIEDAYRNRPMTPDECASAIMPEGMDAVAFEQFKRSVRSRCSELIAQGKLADSLMRKKNASGHPAMVLWTVVKVPVVTIVTTTTQTTASTKAVQQELI